MATDQNSMRNDLTQHLSHLGVSALSSLCAYVCLCVPLCVFMCFYVSLCAFVFVFLFFTHVFCFFFMDCFLFVFLKPVLPTFRTYFSIIFHFSITQIHMIKVPSEKKFSVQVHITFHQPHNPSTILLSNHFISQATHCYLFLNFPHQAFSFMPFPPYF